MDTLDKLIVSSLAVFLRELRERHEKQRPWKGRERDAISLYAFGALLGEVQAGTILFDPRQIGIEVAVRQRFSEEQGGKKRANKDLVIWPSPYMTAWPAQGCDAVPCPLAVLEWKVDSKQKSSTVNDTELAKMKAWLIKCTKENTTTRGYAIHLQIPSGEPPSLKAIRCYSNDGEESNLLESVVAALGRSSVPQVNS